jgi:hypothetical protein
VEDDVEAFLATQADRLKEWNAILDARS